MAFAHAIRVIGVALWVLALWLMSRRLVHNPHGVAEWVMTVVGWTLLTAWLAALIVGRVWTWAEAYERLRAGHLADAGRDRIKGRRDLL